MILNGNQRGGAKDLALHLMKSENEVVAVHELRGFLSTDVMGALNEIYAISRGTKCTQFMYSLSINPPKHEHATLADFEDAIEQAEQRLNLHGQPRAVVFHEKEGRRHAHVVWSRIRIDQMKAVPMSHDYEKLTDLSRELFLHHGWDMPGGLKKRGDRDPTNYTYAQHQQAKRVNKHAADIKRDFQEAWAGSDSRITFEHALAEKGYYLARGDTGRFVAMDMHGEIYPVAKMLPKGINTKHVRARLGDESELPSLDQVRAMLAARREQSPEHSDALKNQSLSVADVLAHVTRFHTAFTPKMMERTLKAHIPDAQERSKTIEDVLKSGEVIRIGKRSGKSVYSTAAMMDLEQRMAHMAEQMARRASHNIDDHAVHRAIFTLNNTLAKETDGKASLSHEQKHALQHMASDKQLSLIVGVAGAGKTTIMAGAKDALETQGYRALGAAPSGIAASGLQEIGMDASTLHSLEYRLKLAQKMLDEHAGKPLTPKQSAFIKSAMLTSKDVLIVDEAGMVSAPQLSRIMELCQQSGTKLVLVGDPQQLQSIEAGTAFKNLLDRNGYADITEVRRQQTGWQREATIQLSKGHVAEALNSYQHHGCITKAKTRSHAKERLVKDVMNAHRNNPDASRLVLAYTRKDVTDLNDFIKAEMVKAGAVSKDNVTIDITVTDGDAEYLKKQGFAMGDRVLFRKNDIQLGVMNGTFGTLREVSGGQFHVELDNGKTVSFSPSDYNHLQLGYATTIHKSQGVTVDESYVLATPHFDQHTSYVALSRHKEVVRLYANRKDFKTDTRLHRVLGRQGDKLSTLDFTDARAPQRITQKNDQRPSFVKRLTSFFLREKEQSVPTQVAAKSPHTDRWINTPEPKWQEENPAPLRTLSQQEFAKLRDEFMQKADMAENHLSKSHSHEQVYHRDEPSIER